MYDQSKAIVVDLLLTAGARPVGPPGTSQPLDTVIKALKKWEETIRNYQWGTDSLNTWTYCRSCFSREVYTFHILVRRLSTFETHYSTPRNIYLLKAFERYQGSITEHFREQLRRRVAEIALMSDRELWTEIILFHGMTGS